MDVKRWKEIEGINLSFFEAINWYMTYKKEFRNLIMHRFKHPSKSPMNLVHYFICRLLWRPMESLFIYTADIGGGLYIQHGVASLIGAAKIGENCTIGLKNDDENNPYHSNMCQDGIVLIGGGLNISENTQISKNSMIENDIKGGA